ncbi:glycine cleavage system H protein [Syncephalis pseudoplumigaleata]|uniref:Glycine cleavage system H protein n=1 Tax=Syncephalis pseudoplumigaleata TaxID=1712513 RepID=A0A4P9Z0R5_9FUNG|nr:glycine cleavage system H protein [Syncephalis pseudoplumigaleata]|eukprot:RKP25472.1 glycine cleavage system H protein [Syncephalis pseudoplumigaleata]
MLNTLGLKYTDDHEWVMLEGNIARMGVTDYAQKQLGDIVFVEEVAKAGSKVEQGEPIATVESVKAVTEVYAPVSGTIKEFNATLDGEPEMINEDPHGDGWIYAIEVADRAEYDKLHDEEPGTGEE